MLRAASSLKWWSLLERLGCSASWLARGLLLLLAVTDTQCKCPMGRLLDCSWTVGGPYLLPQISFPVFRPLGHEVAGILLAVLSSQMRPCWWSLTGVPSCWWNLDLQSCWCSGVPCPGIGWVTSSVSSWLISPATSLPFFFRKMPALASPCRTCHGSIFLSAAFLSWQHFSLSSIFLSACHHHQWFFFHISSNSSIVVVSFSWYTRAQFSLLLPLLLSCWPDPCDFRWLQH